MSSELQFNLEDYRVSFQSNKSISLESSYFFTEIDGNNWPVMTAENISLIKGKAKSGKTKLAYSFVRSIIEGVPLGSLNPRKDSKVTPILYFDTEQAEHHIQDSISSFFSGSNFIGEKNSAPVVFYHLRGISTKHRAAFIDQACEARPPKFVVIDGIRDLLGSINNEEKAARLADWLLQLTSKYGCHIVVILHENKQDSNSRGHLGSEIENKAECVLSVSMSKAGVMNVSNPKSRSIGIVPFQLRLNQRGIPVVYLNKEAITNPNLGESVNLKVRKAAKAMSFSRSDLEAFLKIQFEDLGLNTSDHFVREMIKKFKEDKMLFQEGTEGTRNTRYIFRPVLMIEGEQT
jgi:hypothetical protein